MEAIILTLDVALMTYLCWRIYKSAEKDAAGGLGWLAYKKDDPK